MSTNEQQASREADKIIVLRAENEKLYNLLLHSRDCAKIQLDSAAHWRRAAKRSQEVARKAIERRQDLQLLCADLEAELKSHRVAEERCRELMEALEYLCAAVDSISGNYASGMSVNDAYNKAQALLAGKQEEKKP